MIIIRLLLALGKNSLICSGVRTSCTIEVTVNSVLPSILSISACTNGTWIIVWIPLLVLVVLAFLRHRILLLRLELMLVIRSWIQPRGCQNFNQPHSLQAFRSQSALHHRPPNQACAASRLQSCKWLASWSTMRCMCLSRISCMSFQPGMDLTEDSEEQS